MFLRPFKRVLRMQRCLVGACTHDVTVRRIDNGFNVRVFLDGVLNQEVRVNARTLVGPAIKELLRDEVKNGNLSDMAQATHMRRQS